MRIRKAKSDDLHPVCAIVERSYAAYVPRIGRRPGPMDDDYGDRIDRGLISVAEEDGEVVGLVVLVEKPDHLLVENVAVRPDRQGGGIGRALLDFAEDAARRAGRDELRLYTHEKMSENLVLYGRLGYSVDERREEDGFARVFLSKSV